MIKIQVYSTAVMTVLAMALAGCCSTDGDYEESLVQKVDPIIGTGFHGHTYPGASAPYGMVQLSPDTRTSGWDACSGYHYSDSTILGFSHTHLSGTGCADLGDILFSPGIGDVVMEPENDAVRIVPYRFSHEDESCHPGYYSVRFSDVPIVVELTATVRTGLHRYIFNEASEGKHILIDMNHTLTDEIIDSVRIERTSRSCLQGMRRTQGWVPDQAVYFSAEFVPVPEQIEIINGKQALVLFGKDTDTVSVAVGISAVSMNNALDNRTKEVPVLDFDKIRKETEHKWENRLGSIKVYGTSSEKERIFYTALYHAMLCPNTMNDLSGEFRRHDGSIGNTGGHGNFYSTFSLWDTFRAWHPLQTIIDAGFVNDMVNSLLEMYSDTGELPIWPLWSGETGTMIGYHSVSVIADAFSRGILTFENGKESPRSGRSGGNCFSGFTANDVLDAMVRSSNINKKGSRLYTDYGFVPADVTKESVSLTLEYAYDDWCIARFAEAIGRNDIAEIYYRRAANYINVFDGETLFFRGRNRDGSRTTPFDVVSTGRDYTEATPWHYRFFVPHDVNGLISLFGGRERFIRALDDLFTFESDEMKLDVADVTGIKGQYAQGNEPSHNFAYLYSYAGQPWKTQKYVRELLEEMYGDTPEGIIGNEDCGQMSAWYIMSSLGFYPVCPGTGEYVLTAPLFEKSEITLHNGRVLTIVANNPKCNKYISEILLNGKPLDAVYITYDQIMEGGVLEYKLSRRPGNNPEDRKLPYSMSGSMSVSVPYTTSMFSLYEDYVEFRLESATEGAEIRYTLDGTEPDRNSMLYEKPFRLTSDVQVKAKAFRDGLVPSSTAVFNAVRAEFIPGLEVDKSCLEQGVSYIFSEGNYSSVSDIPSGDTPGKRKMLKGIMNEPSITESPAADHFAYTFSGYIEVKEKGVWEFMTKSDDGSVLYIDGIKVVDNDGSHAAVQASGRIALDAGLHEFRLLYFEDYEGESLEWGWKMTDAPEFTSIPPENLFCNTLKTRS